MSSFTTWRIKTSSAAPSAAGALAHDAGRGRLLYFGGTVAFAKYADTTWTWDGARWEELGVASAPPPRSGAALAYDTRRQRMVLFGGMGVLDGRQRYLFDTWELNGSSWTESSAVGPQDLRDWPSMTYDQARRRIVLWGKQDAEDSRLWEYDGKAWVGSEPPPIEGESGLLGYDAANARLLLHDEQGRTWARASSGGDTEPAGDDTPEGSDPSDSDAGSTQGDADAGTGADDAGDDADERARRGGDSGCVAVPAPRTQGAWALLALVVVLLGRKRRQG